MVKVKFLAQLRQDLGAQERELDINNITIIELLNADRRVQQAFFEAH